MQKNKMWAGAGLVVGVLGLGYGAYAQTGGAGVQPPRLMPYQGYLENNGVPVTVANQSVTFFITDGPDVEYSDICNGSGAAPHCLWKETDALNVANGYFNTVLGDGTAFGASVFKGQNRYLGIRIGTTTLDGKQRLLASPFAITAETATNFNVAGALGVTGDATIGGAVAVHGDVRTDARLIGNVGARVGSHAIGNPSGGDLVVGGGVEIGDSPSTTNPESGDLYVQGNVRIGGNVQVDGNIGGIAVSGEYVATQDNAGSTTTITETNIFQGACFLTSVEVDNADGAGERPGCRVKISGAYWAVEAYVGSSDADAYCKARCIGW